VLREIADACERYPDGTTEEAAARTLFERRRRRRGVWWQWCSVRTCCSERRDLAEDATPFDEKARDLQLKGPDVRIGLGVSQEDGGGPLSDLDVLVWVTALSGTVEARRHISGSAGHQLTDLHPKGNEAIHQTTFTNAEGGDEGNGPIC
jgi:hypothetical protein